MSSNRSLQVRCQHCGRPFTGQAEALIDATQNPQAKARLLSGQLNALRCPHCGGVNVVATPLLYHDAAKELLITYVPMELGLPEAEAEKLLGTLMRSLTDSLPPQQMKGYIFRPRRALTMQGLIEQILEADGVTREQLDAQRNRARVVQQLLQADPATLPALVQEHDAEIDETLIEMFTMLAQQAVEQGRQDVAQGVMALQTRILELSTFGQQALARAHVQEAAIRDVADDLRALPEDTTTDDVLALVAGYASDPDKLQAVVGLARPLFDDAFFQALTVATGQAPAAEREGMAAMGDQLRQYAAAVDEQARAAVAEAVELLRALLQQPNPTEALAQVLPYINETFLAVLNANLQDAERRADLQLSARLRALREGVFAALQSTMQPEIRFINDVLSAPDDAQAQALVREHAAGFGPNLLEMMDAVEEALTARGDDALLQRLAVARDTAMAVFNT